MITSLHYYDDSKTLWAALKMMADLNSKIEMDLGSVVGVIVVVEGYDFRNGFGRNPLESHARLYPKADLHRKFDWKV